MTSVLQQLDWIVLGIYFLALIGVAVWVFIQKNSNTEDYFLAGRNVGWFVIGASIFASNIGSEHVVGLAGTGFESGTPMAHYELHAWIVLLLGWLFLPFYIRSGAFTMPEFLEKRFDSRSRWFLSVFSLLAYVLTKVSITIYAGGIVVSELLGIPFWYGAIGIVVFTGIYTVIGGLKAVIYTETLQTVVLIFGSVVITYLGLQEVGGWSQLRETVTTVSPDHFNMWRPMNDPQFPWTGLLIGGTIVGIWYWCTDQYIVQRTLAAKDLKSARRGALWGAFLKVWPVLIFLIPGLIGAALFEKELLVISTDNRGDIIGDHVFPAMVANLLPEGLRGLVVAGMLAALMSSLSSLFNSTATLFTFDVYKKLKPFATDKKLIQVGRIATFIVVILGLLWIPIMPLISKGGLYQYLQSVQSYLAPPITAVFLFGLFNSRINNKGASWGLSLGFLLGMMKLIIQAFFGKEKIANPEFLAYIGDFNFLYFSGVLFLICSAIICIASYSTSAPNQNDIQGLTYQTLDRKVIRESWDRKDVFATGVILSFVMAIYLYFSFWI